MMLFGMSRFVSRLHIIYNNIEIRYVLLFPFLVPVSGPMSWFRARALRNTTSTQKAKHTEHSDTVMCPHDAVTDFFF